MIINRPLNWWRTENHRHVLIIQSGIWFMLQPSLLHLFFFYQILQEMVKFSSFHVHVDRSWVSGQRGGLSYGSWARKRASSVIPEDVGLPVWRPQSPSKTLPKSPLTAFLIICLSVAQLHPPDKTEMEGFTIDEEEKKENRSSFVLPLCLLTRLENQTMGPETNKSILVMTTRGQMWPLGQNLHRRCEQ